MSNETRSLASALEGINITFPKEETVSSWNSSALNEKVRDLAKSVFLKIWENTGIENSIRPIYSKYLIFKHLANHTECVQGIRLDTINENKAGHLTSPLVRKMQEEKLQKELQKRKENHEQSGGCVNGVIQQITPEDIKAANQAVQSKKQQKTHIPHLVSS